jgi:MFS family permease
MSTPTPENNRQPSNMPPKISSSGGSEKQEQNQQLGGLSPQQTLIPLALTQFIASFAGSNMNVAINSIASDLGTTIQGVQVAITLFLLTMAALMITGSKLTDIWGRKRCLMLGLTVYGIGAILGAIAQGLGLLVVGYSIFEGVGSALMIPPVYIITTVVFTDLASRAKAFGAISGMGGIGAATGPLIGGLITTAISWRVSFLLQAAVVGYIILLSRRIAESGVQGERPKFDLSGAILSALGMFFIVIGILQASSNISLMLLLMVIGAAFLLWFFLHVRSFERAGKQPLLSTKLFKNRTSNLAMVTQNMQWLMLMGISFVVSVFLQVVRGYTSIKTGVIFTAATIGILLSSIAAGRLSAKYSQRALIRSGFVITIAGIAILLALVRYSSDPWSFVPGLFLIGTGVGLMLTPSVNVVQSSFPESDQGEISGLSRTVSNLGSSFGTAIAGTVLISAIALGSRAYALALIVLGIAGVLGLIASLFLPPNPVSSTDSSAAQSGQAEQK